jgi:Putative addiction module component
LISGGERGTRTLDLGIMRKSTDRLAFSTTYRVAPVAIGTTEHNEAALGRKTPAKFYVRAGHNVAGNRTPMQTEEMQLSADQIVEETSDWPEDAVADLVDRILRAKYGEVDASVDKAWQDETRRRLAEMESGRVLGIPLEETLAKARKITGQ